jgi:hypothetical protein
VVSPRRRDVLWRSWEGPGLEHLCFAEDGDGAVADGVVIAATDEQRYRLRYRVETDAAWRVREASVELIGEPDRRLDLRTDGDGHWTDGAGGEISGLAGCLDVDISATPFTNTLPVRRLALGVGESAELRVAYVKVPELEVRAVDQRYTRVEDRTYRYEGLFRDFTADLPVDEDGLVVDYRDTWRRA